MLNLAHLILSVQRVARQNTTAVTSLDTRNSLPTYGTKAEEIS